MPRPLPEDSWKRLRPARDPPQETPTRKWRDGGTLSKYSISFTTDFLGCRKVSHCGSHPVLVACSPAIIFICPHSGLIVCSVGPLMSIPKHPPLFFFFGPLFCLQTASRTVANTVERDRRAFLRVVWLNKPLEREEATEKKPPASKSLRKRREAQQTGRMMKEEEPLWAHLERNQTPARDVGVRQATDKRALACTLQIRRMSDPFAKGQAAG